ncbi:MAG: ROK family transcriptional regulator [Pseudomonadota bacterium]
MDGNAVRRLGEGANQTGVRAHNERLIMSVVQRHGEMPGTEIAKATGLSAQTVSNILRKLQDEGFLLRRSPKRGRVGKPSVPIAVDPDGALAFGLKIGRRSADLALTNMHGDILAQSQTTYRYPMPEAMLNYLSEGFENLASSLTAYQRRRICGIGIAAPSEIWSWVDVLGAPEEFTIWREIDFPGEAARITDLPLFTENDATAACQAEHIFGRGREFSDYAYFFIGSFIGGGIVQNSSVVVGAQGNAGAFGPLRVCPDGGQTVALMDAASLYLLEAAIAETGGDTASMWQMPQDWSAFEDLLDPWIARASQALAQAAHSVCSVIDFEAVLIDGAFPPNVRARIVHQTRQYMGELDLRGLTAPRIEEGHVGSNARVLGAACSPIYAQYFFK